VEAFTSAFCPGDGAVLVIKSINGGLRRRDREGLRLAALEHPHVVLVERYFSAAEIDGLMNVADCYVSLHRSEGFGLTLADAMARGVPVVATRYSGNLTFMNDENSFLVGYERRPVGEGRDPYLPWTCWAEPDLAKSRDLLQKLAGDPAAAALRGRRGQADILARHSVDRTADFVRRRLAAIRTSPYVRGVSQEQRG
jgi:glycosyltransferase involved in cell wall biosynthesis